MGIKAALAPVDIAHPLRDTPVPSANGTDEAEASWAADHLVFHPQPLFAIVIHKELRGAVAVGRIHIVVPEIDGL